LEDVKIEDPLKHYTDTPFKSTKGRQEALLNSILKRKKEEINEETPGKPDEIINDL